MQQILANFQQAAYNCHSLAISRASYNSLKQYLELHPGENIALIEALNKVFLGVINDHNPNPNSLRNIIGEWKAGDFTNQAAIADFVKTFTQKLVGLIQTFPASEWQEHNFAYIARYFTTGEAASFTTQVRDYMLSLADHREDIPTQEILLGNNYSIGQLHAHVKQKQQELFPLTRKTPATILANIKQLTAKNALHIEFMSLGNQRYSWKITGIDSNGSSYEVVNHTVILQPGTRYTLDPKLAKKDDLCFDFEAYNGALVLSKLCTGGNIRIKSNMPVKLQDVKIEGHVYIESPAVENLLTCMVRNNLVINGNIVMQPNSRFDVFASGSFVTQTICNLSRGEVVCAKTLTVHAPGELTYDLDKLEAVDVVDITAKSLSLLQLKDNYRCNLTFEALNAHVEPYSMAQTLNVPNDLNIIAPHACLVVGGLNTEGQLLGLGRIFLQFKTCQLSQGKLTASKLAIESETIHVGLAVCSELDEKERFKHRKFEVITQNELILNSNQPMLLNGARIKTFKGDAFVAAAKMESDSSEFIINSNNPDGVPTASIFAINENILHLHQGVAPGNPHVWDDRTGPRFVRLQVLDRIQNRSLPSAINVYGRVELPVNAKVYNEGGVLYGNFSSPNITSIERVESRRLRQVAFGSYQRKGKWINWEEDVEDRVEVTSRCKPIIARYDDTGLTLGTKEHEAELEGLVFGGRAELGLVQLGPRAARYNMNLGITDREQEFEVSTLYKITPGAYIYAAKVPFMRQLSVPFDRIVIIGGQVRRFTEDNLPYPLHLPVELEIERVVPLFAPYNTLELFGANLNPTQIRQQLLQNTIRLLEELHAKNKPVTMEEISNIQIPILYYVPEAKVLNDGSVRTVLCPKPLAPKKYLDLSKLPHLAQLHDVSANAKLTVSGGLLAWNITMHANSSLEVKRLTHLETQKHKRIEVVGRKVGITDEDKVVITPQINSGIVQAQSIKGECKDFILEGGSIKLAADSNLSVSGELRFKAIIGTTVQKSESFGYVGRRNAHAIEHLTKHFVVEANIECDGKFVVNKVKGDAIESGAKLVNVAIKTPNGQIIKVKVDFRDELPTIYCQYKTGSSYFKTFLAVAVGVAIGVVAPQLLPAWNSYLATMATGALASAASAAIQGGNVLKSALEGAAFAGFGAITENILGEIKALEGMAKTKDAIRVGATTALSTAVHGGNVLKNVGASVGANLVATSILPPSKPLTQTQAALEVGKGAARSVATATIGGVVGGQKVGEALVASGIGAAANVAGNVVGGAVGSAAAKPAPSVRSSAGDIEFGLAKPKTFPKPALVFGADAKKLENKPDAKVAPKVEPKVEPKAKPKEHKPEHKKHGAKHLPKLKHSTLNLEDEKPKADFKRIGFGKDKGTSKGNNKTSEDAKYQLAFLPAKLKTGTPPETPSAGEKLLNFFITPAVADEVGVIAISKDAKPITSDTQKVLDVLPRTLTTHVFEGGSVPNIRNPEAKSGILYNAKMLYKASTGEGSEDVKEWQRNNRKHAPTWAAFNKGLQKSPERQVFDAFTGQVTQNVLHGIQFCAEEAARSNLGEQTKTGKFLRAPSQFIGTEVAKYRLGEKTKTGGFIDNSGALIGADIYRATHGQESVIVKAFADDFRFVANMPPTDKARWTANQLTPMLAGGSLGRGGALVFSMDTRVVTEAAKRGWQATTQATKHAERLGVTRLGSINSPLGRGSYALADALNQDFALVFAGGDFVQPQALIRFGGIPKQPIVFQFQSKMNQTPGVLALPETSGASRLTKGQIVEYLRNVDKVPVDRLAKDLQKVGFEFVHVIPEHKIYKFSHVRNDLRGTGMSKANLESSKVMVEIHFDAKSGPHIHITDAKGNVYDKNLNNLTAKLRRENPGWHARKLKREVESLPDAHIKIKEFVELSMGPKHG